MSLADIELSIADNKQMLGMRGNPGSLCAPSARRMSQLIASGRSTAVSPRIGLPVGNPAGFAPLLSLLLLATLAELWTAQSRGRGEPGRPSDAGIV